MSEYLTGDDNMCPALGCKEQVAADVVFSKTTLRKSISDDLDGGSTSSGFSEKSLVHSEYSSSKIRAVLEILQTNSKASTSTPVNGGSFGCNGGSIHPEDECIEICDSDVDTTKHTSPFPNPTEGPVKTIVFSQWTGMLDLVETSLNLSCIQYRRLDGTMSLVSRDRAVKDFNTDPEVWPLI